MDYEGIGIYENLAEVFKEKRKEHICKEDKLPVTKEKQNRNIGHIFSDFFGKEIWERFEKLLMTEKYIPQEIINVWDMDV